MESQPETLGNDNYHSFSGDSYFSRLFWVLSARFFGVFLGGITAFAGAGFRPPGGEATEGRRLRRVGGILKWQLLPLSLTVAAGFVVLCGSWPGDSRRPG